MEEAQYLCDEISIMDYGKIIARDKSAELIKKHSPWMTVILPKNQFGLAPDRLSLPFKEVKDQIELKTDIDFLLE